MENVKYLTVQSLLDKLNKIVEENPASLKYLVEVGNGRTSVESGIVEDYKDDLSIIDVMDGNELFLAIGIFY